MSQFSIMGRKQTIAGVVLTLNEEQDLPRALNSLSWCDELIVVDSGSTDRTHEVAEQFGAHFLQHSQSAPFLITEQRNWALASAGIVSDWVLFLDADEEVGSELASLILATITSSSTITAYELTPRYLFLGKWLRRTQGYPNWHPRLVKRGRVFFEGGVWESFSPDSLVGRLPIPYEHYAFSKGLDDWLDRHRRYAAWDAQQIFDYLSGDSSSISTRRWRTLRLAMSRLWFLRPPLRFTQKYFLQLGFLEGWQGLLFASMMAFYDLMTVIKVIELRRKRAGQPL